MTMTNGARPMAVQMLQFTLDGGVVLPVRDDDGDRMGAALNDYDDAITALDQALAHRDAAASLYDEADRQYRVATERCRLARLVVQARLAVDSAR